LIRKSESRNRFIVKIFRETGDIEQLGTGIMRIREACRKSDCPEPRFEEIGNFFKATLFRAGASLSPDLENIYDLLKSDTALGSKEIAEKLHIHRNTALKRLRQLEEKGLIHKEGRGPHVRYVI